MRVLFSFVALLISLSLIKSEDISTVAPCFDDPTTDCQDYAALCNNKMYIPFLDIFCPKTCGLCPGDTTIQPVTLAPTCIDSNTNCKNWVKEGYCTACFVDCSDRIKNCAKSCGFCDPSSCINCKSRGKFSKFMFTEISE